MPTKKNFQGKGMDLAKTIKDKERSGISKVVIIEEGETGKKKNEYEFFVSKKKKKKNFFRGS